MFGDNLKRLIGMHGMTARELSGKINVSSQAISEIINGKREPSLKTAKLISEFFEVPLDSMLNQPFSFIISYSFGGRYEKVEAKIWDTSQDLGKRKRQELAAERSRKWKHKTLVERSKNGKDRI